MMEGEQRCDGGGDGDATDGGVSVTGVRGCWDVGGVGVGGVGLAVAGRRWVLVQGWSEA